MIDSEQYCEEVENTLYFDIANPKLWFPRPYGEQPLYTLKITVESNVYEQKFGIRTVKILQLRDTDENVIRKCKELQKTESGSVWDLNEEYSCFILIINGIRIFCTGANWVPCEPFPSAETDEKITKNLELAAESGMNMVRVWGGGIFEKPHFYDECDRLGILVTQDFLMACGVYPENDQEFQNQLRKEAEYAAILLRNHPSFVWWTGDNENAVEGDDTMRAYKGRTSARKIIAPILEKLDYNRPFLYSSPYGGKRYSSKTVGTTHNTHYFCHIMPYFLRDDLSDYREYWEEFTARFIAEEGVMGAVCQKSLDEFISKENQSAHEMWLHHTKNNPDFQRDLIDIMNDFTIKLFGKFKDWDDEYFKMRYLQYEWIRYTLGIARSNLWFNSGMIYWMLNDCWPASMGWAIIDYYNRPKSGYYAVKQYGKQASVYVKNEGGEYRVYVSGISVESIQCELSVFILDLKTNRRTNLYEESLNVCSESVCRPFTLELGEDEILIAEIQTQEGMVRNWYRKGAPNLRKSQKVQYSLTEDGIEVWADEYVHVVEIDSELCLEDNYFSLLPGEKRFIHLDGNESKDLISVLGYTFE